MPHYLVQIVRLLQTVKVSALEELLSRVANQAMPWVREQIRSWCKQSHLRWILHKDVVSILLTSEKKRRRVDRMRKATSFKENKPLLRKLAEQAPETIDVARNVQIGSEAVDMRAESVGQMSHPRHRRLSIQKKMLQGEVGATSADQEMNVTFVKLRHQGRTEVQSET